MSPASCSERTATNTNSVPVKVSHNSSYNALRTHLSRKPPSHLTIALQRQVMQAIPTRQQINQLTFPCTLHRHSPVRVDGVLAHPVSCLLQSIMPSRRRGKLFLLETLQFLQRQAALLQLVCLLFTSLMTPLVPAARTDWR